MLKACLFSAQLPAEVEPSTQPTAPLASPLPGTGADKVLYSPGPQVYQVCWGKRSSSEEGKGNIIAVGRI